MLCVVEGIVDFVKDINPKDQSKESFKRVTLRQRNRWGEGVDVKVTWFGPFSHKVGDVINIDCSVDIYYGKTAAVLQVQHFEPKEQHQRVSKVA